MPRCLTDDKKNDTIQIRYVTKAVLPIIGCVRNTIKKYVGAHR